MSSWRQSYAKLREYITQHTEIEITLNGSCIPGEVREEFSAFSIRCAPTSSEKRSRSS